MRVTFDLAVSENSIQEAEINLQAQGTSIAKELENLIQKAQAAPMPPLTQEQLEQRQRQISEAVKQPTLLEMVKKLPPSILPPDLDIKAEWRKHQMEKHGYRDSA